MSDSIHKNKKILIVTDAWYPQVNGVVRTLTHTRDELILKGHDVTMLTPEGFRTIPCPTYPEIRLALFPASKVAKFIRQISPEIIHIATEGPLGLAARNFCLRNGLHFTTGYHTRFPEYVHSRFRLPLSVSYLFLKWFHKNAQAVMAPTQKVISDLGDHGIGHAVLWPRGVDLELFSPPKSRRKNKTPILLYVGRVAVEKNLEAFLKLNIDAEKWIVGDGPARPALEKAYPDTIFHGMKPKEDLPEYYGKADIFVFPSQTDTFGLVLLEAMACGLPVAAYPVTGPIDVIGSSDAGVLDNDLGVAVKQALKIDRRHARSHAEGFSWSHATNIFEGHLVLAQKDDEYSPASNPYKNNTGLLRAANALKHSLGGLRFALHEESAFRQELFLAIILITFAIWLPASPIETLIMIGSVIFVLIIELVNSSVESAIDRISYEKHGLSKRAKDYGSAAVFLALIWCAIVYLVMIYQYYFS